MNFSQENRAIAIRINPVQRLDSCSTLLDFLHSKPKHWRQWPANSIPNCVRNRVEVIINFHQSYHWNFWLHLRSVRCTLVRKTFCESELYPTAPLESTLVQDSLISALFWSVRSKQTSAASAVLFFALIARQATLYLTSTCFIARWREKVISVQRSRYARNSESGTYFSTPTFMQLCIHKLMLGVSFTVPGLSVHRREKYRFLGNLSRQRPTRLGKARHSIVSIFALFMCVLGNCQMKAQTCRCAHYR